MTKITLDIKKLWGNHKGWILASVLGLLSSSYYFGKDVVTDYLDRKEQAEFNGNLIEASTNDSVVLAFLNNPVFIKLFFESPMVQEQITHLGTDISKEIHNNIVSDIIKKDTNKVSSRAYVAKELEIRDEAYLPLLVKALRAVKDKENASKADVKGIIKREVKPEARRVPVF